MSRIIKANSKEMIRVVDYPISGKVKVTSVIRDNKEYFTITGYEVRNSREENIVGNR